MRLFIAVPFSNPVRNALGGVVDRLRKEALEGRFTRPENLHLTLAFLGETEDTPALRELIGRIAPPAFSLEIGGLGRFGDLYWAGVRESPALRALASSLRRALKEAGYPVDDKPFRPHITLARQARFASPPRIEPPALSMTADQIILMESKRIDGRLVYVPRFRKTLLGA